MDAQTAQQQRQIRDWYVEDTTVNQNCGGLPTGFAVAYSHVLYEMFTALGLEDGDLLTLDEYQFVAGRAFAQVSADD